jgi:hypothetical protein
VGDITHLESPSEAVQGVDAVVFSHGSTATSRHGGRGLLLAWPPVALLSSAGLWRGNTALVVPDHPEDDEMESAERMERERASSRAAHGCPCLVQVSRTRVPNTLVGPGTECFPAPQSPAPHRPTWSENSLSGRLAAAFIRRSVRFSVR